ncbi:hypothetical protein BaRGS_00009423 [Batillaria attramentaria]|uniref:Uncharacterized protein n=1 Tax=Batillaria attramentaria TaxID=370345 RepID=A0ABD0LJ49_9CAEN
MRESVQRGEAITARSPVICRAMIAFLLAERIYLRGKLGYIATDNVYGQSRCSANRIIRKRCSGLRQRAFQTRWLFLALDMKRQDLFYQFHKTNR